MNTEQGGQRILLCKLTSTIEKSLQTKEITLCTFLDIEGAFNNTSHLLQREHWNTEALIIYFPGGLGRCSSLEKQSQKQDGQTVQTTRGCPQGGVLSPLIWSRVVDELLSLLTTNGIPCQFYADDIVIIGREKRKSALCDITQRGLQIVQRRCKAVGSKTTIIASTNKITLNNTHPIYGVQIEPAKESKYLGLDSKLLWKSHLLMI